MVSLLAAAGLALGHANPLFQEPLAALLFPAGLIWLALTARGAGQAMARGFWTATLGYLGCLYWVAVPVHHFGNVPWLLAAPCPVLLSMVLACFPALFCLGMHAAGRGVSLPACGLLAGALWGCMELGQEQLFTGFPWLPLASALVARPWAAQGVALVGAAGLGALLAAAMAWLSAPALGRRTPAARLLGVLLLAAWAVHGLRQAETPLTAGAAVPVGIVQGNVDQSLKWDAQFRQETLRRYLEPTRELVAAGARLVVWPETALPFFLQDQHADSQLVRDFAGRQGVLLLAGSPAYEVAADGATLHMFNRAWLLGPGGDDLGHYDKEHLVPFGEYVPFGQYLPISRMVEGIGDFLPGRSQQPLAAGNLALGVLICYEAIFPDLAQARVAAGANVLVNISNDAWFLRTSAPLQHLRLAALRAVEQGRWMIRATNTGISAFIDPRGRVLSASGLFVAAAPLGEVQAQTDTTPFHRAYRPLRLGIVALGAVLLLAGLTKPPKRYL